MTKPNPNIAVITAAYNASQFIHKTIGSVGAQTYPKENIRHYICDDDSTDDTVGMILDNLRDGYKTVELFDYTKYEGESLWGIQTTILALKKNGRQGRARNHCIRAAWNWADAFVVLDADDVKYPNFISRHVEEWLVDPELIYVTYSDYDIYDENTKLTIHEFKNAYNSQFLKHSCIVSSGALISKKAFEKAGLYDETCSPAEDYHLWMKISNFGMFIHIAQNLWMYRVHEDNSTNSKNMERIQEAHRLMAESYNKWTQNPQGYNN